ncbi:MAG: bifunctional ADP-heptose synthase [Opitutales bacterium]|nr:bifunctional ADP-heptose synthase [Opitutales bacterium]
MSPIQHFVEKISQLRVLVVGDIIFDRYVFGAAQRISSEAPVPVIEVDSEADVAGGAANVAMNIAGIGGQVSLMGTVGCDAAFDDLRAILEHSHIHCDAIEASPERNTVEKTRVLAQRQQVCRIDREGPFNSYQLSDASLDALSLEPFDLVIVSDYSKGSVDDRLLKRLKTLAGDTPICIDPKPPRVRNYSDLTLIKPNQKEALLLAGQDPAGPFNAESVIAELHSRYQPKHIVITLGSDGMLLSSAGKPTETLPTEAREVFDVSGAGDTVISLLGPALALGYSLQEAAVFANIAAGIVVGRMGTYAIKREDLIDPNLICETGDS